ncbi:hypothetical protein N0V84_004294 [Fusarium piperis]|uniref:Uncharacterized protein n=1 Tax=Fusarium piperis TaxID=1435070 RepID=A0A9W9BQD6_9HYPO|nr:hypothetical protein N0V84_004294 [Fusarium piperis]
MNALECTTEQLFDQSFNTNFNGPYFIVLMTPARKPSHTYHESDLVSSSVLHQSQVTLRHLLYASTKGSIEQLTRMLAKNLGAKYEITANAVAPGRIETELFFKGKSHELIDNIANFSLLSRLGKPDSRIASLMVFLARPSSS